MHRQTNAVATYHAGTLYIPIRRTPPAVAEIAGGKSEPWETSRGAAVRELQEELGLILDPDKLEHLGEYSLGNGWSAIAYTYELPEPPAVPIDAVDHNAYMGLGALIAPATLDVIIETMEWRSPGNREIARDALARIRGRVEV